jgi:hypothetical protein
VRVIVDPIAQLRPQEHGAVTFAGVRSATSLKYTFTLSPTEPEREEA